MPTRIGAAIGITYGGSTFKPSDPPVHAFAVNITGNSSLERATLSGTAWTSLYGQLTVATGFAVDHQNGHVYFIDRQPTPAHILRINVDGTGLVDLGVVGGGLWTDPEEGGGVVADTPAGRMIYLCSGTDRKVYAGLLSNLPALAVVGQLHGAGFQPRDVLYFEEKLYVAHRNAGLYRYSYLHVQEAQMHAGNAWRVAIDPNRRRLYFTDQTSLKIKRMAVGGALDSGVNIADITGADAYRMLDFDPIRDRLYFARSRADGDRTVHYSDPDGGGITDTGIIFKGNLTAEGNRNSFKLRHIEDPW